MRVIEQTWQTKRLPPLGSLQQRSLAVWGVLEQATGEATAGDVRGRGRATRRELATVASAKARAEHKRSRLKNPTEIKCRLAHNRAIHFFQSQ